jgi:hypothetical protein
MCCRELYDVIHRRRFEAFRIRLTDGQAHTIRHPDLAWLTQGSVYIGLPSGDDEVPDRAIQCGLPDVVSVEPANGKSGRPRQP